MPAHRIGRLSVLQQSLHEQLGSLEEQQSRERVTNQRSLKEEMQQMQTRLLQESVRVLCCSALGGFFLINFLDSCCSYPQQKCEMARIKQSLHTMLMKL